VAIAYRTDSDPSTSSRQIFQETSFMPIAWRIALGTKVAGEQKSCQVPGKYRKKPLDFFGAPAFVSPSVSRTYARRGPTASSVPSPGWHGSCSVY